ncbi:hypothetical protein ACJX0J_040344, partial [Zea mays]
MLSLNAISSTTGNGQISHFHNVLFINVSKEDLLAKPKMFHICTSPSNQMIYDGTCCSFTLYTSIQFIIDDTSDFVTQVQLLGMFQSDIDMIPCMIYILINMDIVINLGFLNLGKCSKLSSHTKLAEMQTKYEQNKALCLQAYR